MHTPNSILLQHPFFQAVPEEYKLHIASRSKIIHAHPGDILFREGAEANRLYFILSGSVAIETLVPHRGLVTIQTVESGELIGWSWLVPPYKYRFGARVVQNSELMVMDGEDLRYQCERDPRLGYELMKRVAQAISIRLEQTRLQAADNYGSATK